MVDFKKTFVGYFNEQVQNGHFDSQLPPPIRHDTLRPPRAPRGTRTPSEGVASLRAPSIIPPAHDNPGWRRRAGRLIAALEDALAQESDNPGQIAAIERAWFAYEMGGASDKEIALVAHLCERAHGALQGKMSGPISEAYAACAHVLYAGLPTRLKRNLKEYEVLDVVKEMRRTVDPWEAVVHASCILLGWDIHWREHAAQAIRIALNQHSNHAAPKEPSI